MAQSLSVRHSANISVRFIKNAKTMLTRITIDPEICHGKPTIRGSRLLVTTVLELLASGMTWDEIQADYPGLEPEDIRACLNYAVQLAHFSTIPLAA